MITLPNKNSRICIIGAGPGGLSTAEALRERGYTHITILEKRNRVGGQSMSLAYKTSDGRDIIYEIGSIQPTSSTHLFRLIKRYGLHLGKSNRIDGMHKIQYLKIYSIAQQKDLFNFSKYNLGLSFRQFCLLLTDIPKLAICIFKYRKLKNPGFNLTPQQFAELSIPFEDWVDQQNFSLLDTPAKMLAMLGTLANPDLRKELPAYVSLKFVFQCLKWPPTQLRYVNGVFKLVEEGFQELWNRVAKQHTVLFNANIIKINRNKNEIEVELEDRKLLFDKLIVTCSLPRASQFLEMSMEEQQLFNKVKYMQGWRVAFLAKNLPHDGVYFLVEPYMKKMTSCISYFQAEGEIGQGVWLYTATISNTKNESIDCYLKEAEKFLRDNFNAEDIQWIKTVYWPEFNPHFAASDVKNGIYAQFENLQGKNNTYYVGDTLSGCMHANVADYAYAKVKEFFE